MDKSLAIVQVTCHGSATALRRVQVDANTPDARALTRNAIQDVEGNEGVYGARHCTRGY